MAIHAKSLFAETYVVTSSVTSMSIAQASGSTIFGNSADDTHQFVGSITASNDISGSSTSTGSFGKLRLSDSLELNTGTSTDAIIHSGGDNAAGTGNTLKLITGTKDLNYSSYIEFEPGSGGDIIINPQKQLELYSQLVFFSDYSMTTSGFNDLSLTTRDGSTPWAGYGASSQIIIGSNTNAGINLYTHGTGTVYISGSSAGDKLEVVGGIKATGNISGSATSTGSFGKVTVGTAGSVVPFHVNQSTTDKIAVFQTPTSGNTQGIVVGSSTDGATNGQGFHLGYHQAQDFGFVDAYDWGGGGYQKIALNLNLYVVGQNNVGIGVSDPDAKLEVAGTTHFQGVSTFDNNITAAGNISGSSTSTGSFGHFTINEGTPQHSLTVVSKYNTRQYPVASFFTKDKSMGVYIHDKGIGTSGYTADGSTSVDANTDFQIDARGSGDLLINTIDGANVGIGVTSPKTQLDVQSYQADGITIGADNDANKTRTNSATKTGGITGVHYLNAEESIRLLGYSSISDANIILIGGGNSDWNAATQIQFWTAATYNTTGGTKTLEIHPNKISGSSTSTGSFGDGFLDDKLFIGANHTTNIQATDLHIASEGPAAGNIVIEVAANATSGPALYMGKARGTNASISAINHAGGGDVLGNILFAGYDGAHYRAGADIIVTNQAGSSQGTDMPANMSFRVSDDGSSSPSDRLVLTYDNKISGSAQSTASFGTLRLDYDNLPTSDPSVKGAVWRDGTDLKISAG